MASTTASAIRPSLRDNRQLSGSPHTPSRFISSSYSSPGSTFRQEEDAIIIELDPRTLKAGFEGESGPQCVLSFSTESAKRVGDYRVWLPDYKGQQKDFAREVEKHELWRNDLSDFDLGLMEDKLERAVREAYNKYLLTDAGKARLVLVLPSLVPLTVLSSMLTILFERWQYSTITMLPAPTMCALAAGVRSALVVDIGWEETVVTPVYEYRELQPRRSTRGMKRLVEAMAEKLKEIAEQQPVTDDDALRQDFGFVEDFVTRMAFCNPSNAGAAFKIVNETQMLSLREDGKDSSSTTLPFDWPCHATSQEVTVKKEDIGSVVDDTLFGGQKEICHDDHEQPLDLLVYYTLLRLPPDIRGVCMSRIAFCGQGEAIPGLKQRIMDDVTAMTSKHQWNAIRGQNVKQRKGLVEIAQGRAATADYKHNITLTREKDFVDEKFQKQKAKETPLGPQGVFRSIDTLGPWAGASLLTSLKIKGIVEVERERFLSHGLAGASREHEVSVIPQARKHFRCWHNQRPVTEQVGHWLAGAENTTNITLYLLPHRAAFMFA